MKENNKAKPFKLVAHLPGIETREYIFNNNPYAQCKWFGINANQQARLRKGEMITIKRITKRTTHPLPVGTEITMIPYTN